MWLAWGIVGVMAVMTVFLLCGKGTWMVAGFNTMSEEEKAEYDKKKVARSSGWTLLLLTVPMIPLVVWLQTQVWKAQAGEALSSGGIAAVALSFSAYMVVVVIVSCVRGFKNCKK